MEDAYRCINKRFHVESRARLYETLFSDKMLKRDDFLELLGIIMECKVNHADTDDGLAHIIRGCLAQNATTEDFMNILKLCCTRYYPSQNFNRMFNSEYTSFDKEVASRLGTHESNSFTSLKERSKILHEMDVSSRSGFKKTNFHFLFKMTHDRKGLDRIRFLETGRVRIEDREYFYDPKLFSIVPGIPKKNKYSENMRDLTFKFV